MRALLLMALMVQTARAEFLFEPEFGPFSGTYSYQTTEDDYEGQQVGLRVGLDKQFQVGLEGGYHVYNIDGNYPIQDRAFREYLIGMFLGVRLSRFRASVSWLATSLEKQEGEQERLFGEAYRAGIGFLALPVVSINLNFGLNRYDEIERTNGSTLPLDSELEHRYWLLTVSFPFLI